ncbi:5-formyltetrahydrofolate cyclo-ligase [Aestuariivirga litoralis]|uniref:5-formyltetrahydrofolate cyclo-ligase n=1 Tax=Aestuariivirga litoralis TaxID=2650924 RepID=UPI0018C60C2A|nr:5-formyltetrahydrofolate cyclo-ligase [Aestuariivirga litoralis]MBG1230870.1 5-formyltetrahydrofolate cyclo-ligase [Aestuariivirga litoralis]
MTFELPADKAAARKMASGTRLKAHEQMKESAPLLLASHGFPARAEPGFNVVSAFFPVRSEIDTRPLLGRLAGEGWTTCLPIVIAEGQPLSFRRWLPGEPLDKGFMNIDIPLDTSPEVEPDVLIVPLLAFDRKGFRLGYGGGFYDRTLDKLRAQKKIIAIGAAYAAQEVEEVPHHAHDQHLDFVMTERGVIACG